MNTYQTKFFATCPNNGIRISYDLSIHTTDVLPVEQIVAAVHGLGDKFHETLADELHEKFGGDQVLIADHHGVWITTHRPMRPVPGASN